jgi:hypothetical protein
MVRIFLGNGVSYLLYVFCFSINSSIGQKINNKENLMELSDVEKLLMGSWKIEYNSDEYIIMNFYKDRTWEKIERFVSEDGDEESAYYGIFENYQKGVFSVEENLLILETRYLKLRDKDDYMSVDNYEREYIKKSISTFAVDEDKFSMDAVFYGGDVETLLGEWKTYHKIIYSNNGESEIIAKYFFKGDNIYSYIESYDEGRDSHKEELHEGVWFFRDDKIIFDGSIERNVVFIKDVMIMQHQVLLYKNKI